MEKNKEILSPLERGLQALAIAGIFLVAGFLYLHQLMGTGFFTEAFGRTEKLALYGPLFLSICAPLARMFSGQRNPGRFFEAWTGLALAIGSYHLIRIFPFDFSHLGDPLPAFLRWPIIWIRDPIARIILWIQVFAGSISLLSNGVRFTAGLEQ